MRTAIVGYFIILSVILLSYIIHNSQFDAVFLFDVVGGVLLVTAGFLIITKEKRKFQKLIHP